MTLYLSEGLSPLGSTSQRTSYRNSGYIVTFDLNVPIVYPIDASSAQNLSSNKVSRVWHISRCAPPIGYFIVDFYIVKSF